MAAWLYIPKRGPESTTASQFTSDERKFSRRSSVSDDSARSLINKQRKPLIRVCVHGFTPLSTVQTSSDELLHVSLPKICDAD